MLPWYDWLAIGVLGLFGFWAAAVAWLRFWQGPLSETTGEQMDRWERIRLNTEATKLSARLRTILARPVEMMAETRQELRLLFEILDHRYTRQLGPPEEVIEDVFPREEPPLGGGPGVTDPHSDTPLSLAAGILMHDLKKDLPPEPEIPTLWDRLNEE
jgi:hypothetical protein